MVYILFNPYADNGCGAENAEKVKAQLAAQAPELLDLTALDARAFLSGLPADDRVFLLGGDGSINRLVNDLEGKAPAVPVYIRRLGTGNDFLRDVTADADPKAESVLLNDHLKNVPCAEIDGRRFWFLNGCCGGVDALVCARMNEQRGKKPSYVTTAIRSFFKDYRTTSARVTVDGETRSYDRVWMAGAMNGRYQGGGMLFAPGQDRSGDLLTCFVWHGTSALGTLACFPFISNGTHTRFTRFCDIRRGRRIEIEYDDPVFVQFDGETVSGVTRLTVCKESFSSPGGTP